MRRTIASLIFIGLAFLGNANAQSLLKDLNALPRSQASSDPEQFVEFRGNAYFVARLAATGTELFRTDGTSAGTELLKDLTPGSGSSLISDLFVAGNQLFFGARTPLARTELWVSDGTTAGTRLVKDISPVDGFRGGFAALGARVYFAGHATNGTELWTSDGTAAGTFEVVDLYPGGDSGPTGFMSVGSYVVFNAADPNSADTRLISSDGSAVGTTQIGAAILAGNPRPIGRLGGRLLIGSDSGTLAMTDGTDAGTFVIGSGVQVLGRATANGNELFFVGRTAAEGDELWATDGTAAGTRLVRDISAGPRSPGLSILGVAGGQLTLSVFNALWISDGTASGTRWVHSVRPATRGEQLAVTINNRTFFSGQRTGAPYSGTELWVTDGTATGTFEVADLHAFTASSSPEHFVKLGSRALFAATDHRGTEPWISDGTAVGTQQIDLAPPGSNGATGDSLPDHWVDWLGTPVFMAVQSDGQSAPVDGPVRSDGTAAGTGLYHAFPGNPPFIRHGGYPLLRLHVNQGVLTTIVDEPSGWPQRLWSDDGTGPVVGDQVTIGGHYPLGASTTAGGYLWLSGELLYRVRGSRVTPNILSLTTHATRLGAVAMAVGYGPVGQGLFACDGTACQRVATTGGSDFLVRSRSRVFLQGFGPNGSEPWVSDGTTAGTYELDLRPGPDSSFPTGAAPLYHGIVFSAHDGTAQQIHFTDGTSAGTIRLSSFRNDSYPQQFTTVGGERVVFTRDNRVDGEELWVADLNGVQLVDLNQGSGSSNPLILGPVGDEVWFSTQAPPALWRTDGTVAGTRKIMDGTTSRLLLSGGRVYFDHQDLHGREPWTAWPGATHKQFGSGCGVGPRAPWLECRDPVLGRPWRVTGGGGPPGSVGILVLGRPAARPTRYPGACVDYLDPTTLAVVHTVGSAGSDWYVDFGLPDDPALHTMQLVMQLWTGPSGNPSGVETAPAMWLSLDNK